jgi:peroxiredoxin
MAENPRPRISPILLILPIAGIIFALVMLVTSPQQQTPTITRTSFSTPVTMNKPAPAFNLSDLNGSPVSLSDYAGRVVFINFWWTGCPPCVKELPAFQEFAAAQGENGAVVLAVNTAETPEQINAFLTENQINLSDVPVLLDTDYRVMRSYGVAVFPTTYVISPDGVINGVKFGAFTVEELNAYLESAV